MEIRYNERHQEMGQSSDGLHTASEKEHRVLKTLLEFQKIVPQWA